MIVAVTFVLLILFGMPIGFAIGLAGVVGLIDMGGGPNFLAIGPSKIFNGLNIFPFLAMPFFILAGEIMNGIGITDRLVKLAQEYAPDMVEAFKASDAVFDNATLKERFEPKDDFGAARVGDISELKELFATPFYFGCEADDRTSAWAYSTANNPFGARLNTLFGSDIGHFDVSDMANTICEAHKLVEKGVITGEDYRRMMFENPARFWGEGNPGFFAGTSVESQVNTFLAASKAA